MTPATGNRRRFGWRTQILCVLLMNAGGALAAVRTTVTTGNWSDPTIWNGGVLTPQAGDFVTIGHAVTLDVSTPVLGSFANNAMLTFSQYTQRRRRRLWRSWRPLWHGTRRIALRHECRA